MCVCVLLRWPLCPLPDDRDMGMVRLQHQPSLCSDCAFLYPWDLSSSIYHTQDVARMPWPPHAIQPGVTAAHAGRAWWRSDLAGSIDSSAFGHHDPVARHKWYLASIITGSPLYPEVQQPLTTSTHQPLQVLKGQVRATSDVTSDDAGLASAMYVRDGQQVPNPDSTSGLYIRKQDGTVVQVRVPADHVAFQMGEAMQACLLAKHSRSDVRYWFTWRTA